MKTYGITSRQFNSLRMQLDGKVISHNEKRKLDIEELESKIKYLNHFIDRKSKQKEKLFNMLHKMKPSDRRFQRCSKKYRNLKLVLHQKKRRLRNLGQKWNKLKADEKGKILRICFGSKVLFHKQFHLKANHYNTHQEWKKEW